VKTNHLLRLVERPAKAERKGHRKWNFFTSKRSQHRDSAQNRA
jgi:hypothetical protein